MSDDYHKPEMVTLREYIEARLESLALAVEKQETAYNLRFEGVNEWRQTYADLVNQAVSKEIFDNRMAEFERRVGELEQRMTDRISNLEQRQSESEGKALGYAAGLSGAALVLAIVLQLLNIGG